MKRSGYLLLYMFMHIQPFESKKLPFNYLSAIIHSHSTYGNTYNNNNIHVIKSNGEIELYNKTLIELKLQSLLSILNISDNSISIPTIEETFNKGLYDNIQISDMVTLLSETIAYMSSNHTNYSMLASSLLISQLHKHTHSTFSDTIEYLFSYNDSKTGKKSPLVSADLYNFVKSNKQIINSAIMNDMDYKIDYFGFKTLEKSYLIKTNDKIIERPQYLFMRVAIGIHLNNISNALETYYHLSHNNIIHASPTLFNAGTNNNQCSSCYLLQMPEDSIEGIFTLVQNCARISKGAGGIGISVSNIRSKGSFIHGTKGVSSGIVPMLRVFDATAKYVDQGGGKRPGAIAVYLEPWHADIFDFLLLKKNSGKEELRARDLFYGLWIPDLFMKRVEENAPWALMCPHECPGLTDTFGEEFENLYLQYEKSHKYKKIVPARELWYAILDSQMETGTPYMLYKDACNRKSNHKHLGTIKGSNLCTEIIEYTSKDEVAVCNLGSIILSKCLNKNLTQIDYEKLISFTRILTRNLNRIIDINSYPVKEANTSNNLHRPIGIGVQGLADLFQLMKLPFDSIEAKVLNKEIFETIYFAALDESCNLAELHGPYQTYEGSPASQGILQQDMWEQKDGVRHDWKSLRNRIKIFGLRNSLLVAPMPTASTAQIFGNNECFEPYTSNIYVRRVRAGEFIVINRFLINDLIKLNIWNEDVREKIMRHGGSVQNISEIPQELKNIYKTVWEIKQRVIIDMAADRGVYIDQSQSLNVFMEEPNYQKLTAMHFYGWKKGLKTGMYYLRTKPAVNAIQFTLSAASKKYIDHSIENTVIETDGHVETCLACSG